VSVNVSNVVAVREPRVMLRNNILLIFALGFYVEDTDFELGLDMKSVDLD